MENLTDFFLLLGGIALFLYGISFMSKSLEAAAGSNLRVILEKMTSNGFKALLVGTFVTALIQSSGACGVMVVGFVNAQLMNLTQALFVMLGANIGTTITAQIIAFKIETIAPLILFVGMILYMFVKNKTVKKIGGIVLGFGLLFVGIYLMGDATDKLNLSVVIGDYLKRYSNPFLLLMFGFVFTAIIQSSSASVGILQVLVASAAGHAIGLSNVTYMILGMNIGACSPIVIASLSGNKSSRRTGLANVVTKVLGVAIFSILVIAFPSLTSKIEAMTPDDVPRQIANFHLLFNLVSSLLLCPFVPLISKGLMKLMPDDPKDDMESLKFVYITPEVMLTPSIAVKQAHKEIMRMSDLAINNLEQAIGMFFGEVPRNYDHIFEVEKTINYLNHELTGFLVRLHGQNLADKELEQIGMMFHVISDIERIGDHAENITEYAQIADDHKIQFSPEAREELIDMAKKSLGVCKLSAKVYDMNLFNELDEVTRSEEEVDEYQTRLTENHIARLKKDKCNPRGGVMFTDMVTDLERCSDHAINIAYAINGENTVDVKKAYIVTRGGNMD